MKPFPDSIRYVHADLEAGRISREAIAARALDIHKGPAAAIEDHHAQAVEALGKLAAIFGFELHTASDLFALFNDGFASGTDYDEDELQTWDEAAREAFSIERPELAERAFAARAATIDAPIPVPDPITANDDVEPDDTETTVTLADAVNVWKGYAEAALHAGMTFPKAQEAFKVPFPLHHRLVFGKALAPALAAE